MKSGAWRAPPGHVVCFKGSELFEIAAIAHRYDNAFRCHHQPASILALDLFDGPETGQWRAGHDLIHVTMMSLHVNVAIAGFADRPVGEDRWPRRLCVGPCR